MQLAKTIYVLAEIEVGRKTREGQEIVWEKLDWFKVWDIPNGNRKIKQPFLKQFCIFQIRII